MGTDNWDKVQLNHLTYFALEDLIGGKMSPGQAVDKAISELMRNHTIPDMVGIEFRIGITATGGEAFVKIKGRGWQDKVAVAEDQAIRDALDDELIASIGKTSQNGPASENGPAPKSQ